MSNGFAYLPFAVIFTNFAFRLQQLISALQILASTRGHAMTTMATMTVIVPWVTMERIVKTKLTLVSASRVKTEPHAATVLIHIHASARLSTLDTIVKQVK